LAAETALAGLTTLPDQSLDWSGMKLTPFQLPPTFFPSTHVISVSIGFIHPWGAKPGGGRLTAELHPLFGGIGAPEA